MSTASHTAATGPTWHILGTGAMACLWADSLCRAGYTIRLLGRKPPAHQAYHAVTIVTAAGAHTHRLCVESGSDSSPISRLLVCTKAGDAQAAVATRASRVAGDAGVVLLQNGMGFQQAVCELLPGASVFCAVTTEGVWKEGPFRVHHAGSGQTQLGAWPTRNPKAAARIAAELGRGSLPVQAVANIEPLMLLKLAVSCAINPLTALHACPNGALLDELVPAQEFDALCTELEHVFAALGHAHIAAGLRTEAKRVARATAANRSSMLQDLQAGRPTEIDFITGFLCAHAAAAGIPCRRNEALLAAIHARQAA